MWQAGGAAEAIRELGGGGTVGLGGGADRALGLCPWHEGPLGPAHLPLGQPAPPSAPHSHLTSLIHWVFGNIGDIFGCVLGWKESEEAS